MTDYLELLLAVLEAQEEPEAILRLPRRRRATGRADGAGEQETAAAPQTVRSGEASRSTPEEGGGAASEPRQAQDALYREMTSARETLRRREQAARRPKESTARRSDEGAAECATEWDLWRPLPGAQERARYAALVDEEFQRDARRYDGALGLL